MATIGKDPNGRKRILYVDGDGNRQTIYLGKMNLGDARTVKAKIESILSAKAAGNSPDPQTAAWTAEIDETLAKKLAKKELISYRQRKSATLETFIESYISRRVDVSPHTQRIWRQTKRILTENFGEDKSLAEITKGDAKDWRLSLVAKGLADATVRKHCGFAKHFFAQAVDHEYITSNPFAGLASSPVGNESRQYFVSREETAKVIDACPDAEWRLIVALSRYAGFRCPSEHLALRLDDIDWEHDRILVTSPKTARHAGHESRVIPIFPELRPYLEAIFHTAEDGTEFFINRYRNAGANIRTQMTRIVKNAGLKPWPRIFHNLRSSRQTELEETFPSHVVCKWIGNSPQVARKHYLQTTDEHFERAIKDNTESNTEATQNTTQQPHACDRRKSQRRSKEGIKAREKEPVLLNETKRCEKVQKAKAEVHGNRTHRTQG